ncbi:MAG: hypothetical protein JWO89_1327 [Verrucomicrobiaceae bacterium]|nr:hypothetical protein [Verrucomicrobiaceae bacterium]
MMTPLLHQPMLGCATCTVDPDSPLYQAQQGAVLFMLAVVFAMLGMLLFIFVNFARKQRRALAAAQAAGAPI